MNAVIKTPWHLWVIGGLSLLWNAFPVVDFTLTNMGNEFWLSALSEPQRAFILGSPGWVTACWALGGFGSFLGSLLLLLRSRHALLAWLASAVGLAGVSYYQLVQASDRVKPLFGDGPLYTYIAIWAVLVALIFYARAMKAKGVLR
ncbi:MAG TPA: hypothetical protein PKD99_15225 [Sphingopyxis sp.]|nr:hypothetical protein [Sphingopyxis sp.]HMP46449.1 hypothetical protein [Sphingopyxis sp.]HMQ18645.1 hypothetical protein [Sphingopyxis sp.]